MLGVECFSFREGEYSWLAKNYNDRGRARGAKKEGPKRVGEK
jgi:hypothetical protein